MDDFEVLFHNPESLSNEELYSMRQKISFMNNTFKLFPFVTASFYYVGFVVGLRRLFCWKKLAASAGAGLGIAQYGSYSWRSSLKKKPDEAVLNAYTRKWHADAYQAMGYGGAYVRDKELNKYEDFNAF